ncbi:MAG TPA: phenylacetate--CoA ligase family protein [Chloroflexia bacterium]
MEMPILWSLIHDLEQLRKRDRWTREQLQTFQEQALSRMRQYAYARSPFYQQFHAGLMDRPLQDLPVLTKSMLMEHFDDLVTDRAVHLEAVRQYVAGAREAERFLGRYWVNATSGSSGRPGIFLLDRTEWAAVLASFARAQEWAGAQVRLTQQTKLAAVASTDPRHMSAAVGATVRSWWMPTLRLAASDPLPDIVAQLNAWQPDLLVSYASMARILADEQLAGRLRITPHLVFTSSEVLTDETRRLVAAAWGQEPFNQYAATESGGLAAECVAHRGMHLFEDLVIPEVVDEHNRPVAPGTFGAKLLITVLASRTLPLIRYELSDSLRLSTATCPCGRHYTLIDAVQGRREDILHFPSAAGADVAVQPHTFHRILDQTPVSGWRVVQEADGGLTILLSGISAGAIEEALAQQVRVALAAQRVSVPYVHVMQVDTIPKGASGKAPLIQARPARTASPAASAAPAGNALLGR